MLLKLKTQILWTQNKGSGNISDKLFTSNLSPLLPHQRFAQTLPTNPALPPRLQTRQRRLKMSELLHLCSVTKFTCCHHCCRFSFSFPRFRLWGWLTDASTDSRFIWPVFVLVFFLLCCTRFHVSTYGSPAVSAAVSRLVHRFVFFPPDVDVA